MFNCLKIIKYLSANLTLFFITFSKRLIKIKFYLKLRLSYLSPSMFMVPFLLIIKIHLNFSSSTKRSISIFFFCLSTPLFGSSHASLGFYKLAKIFGKDSLFLFKNLLLKIVICLFVYLWVKLKNELI